MSPVSYSRSLYSFTAGPLGCLEGWTISSTSPSTSPLSHYFGGIPYALPPIGPHRFARPRPLPDHFRYGTKANPARFTGQCAYCPQWRLHDRSSHALVDEDCLQLNMYIPARNPPTGGWPVLFYIHGGFLQCGTPNDPPENMTPLLSETAFGAIIVAPAYRLNLFGFLAGTELQAEAECNGQTAGNLGFWDQRCALHWTASHIAHFGGDPRNITVAGYSAGAHSAFHQLAHELYYVPDEQAIIQRVIMWSNSPGIQPRTPVDHQGQFDELLEELEIPLSLSADDKLAKLRSLSTDRLVAANNRMQRSEFRATTDDSFVHPQLMPHIDNGDFGRRMKTRGITLLNGECRDEHTSYRTWRTPSNSFTAVRDRLVADYPDLVVDRLMHHYCGHDQSLPADVATWQDLFGRIYANMQVHGLERGLHRGLAKGGLQFGHDVLRYRIEWRASCVDGIFPPSLGVTHASDLAIWFWGLDFGPGLADSDKPVAKPWNNGFAAFVAGERVLWGLDNAADERQVRRLRSDGQTDVWEDELWEEGCRVWDLVNEEREEWRHEVVVPSRAAL